MPATDSPRTNLAAIKLKKLIGRAGVEVGKAIKEIVTSVATVAAKKSMGL